MDIRTQELVNLERNKIISVLEAEELKIRRELQVNIDKQTEHQAKVQLENLKLDAAGGDQESLARLEEQAIAKADEVKTEDVRDEVEEMKKELEKTEKEEAKIAEKEMKANAPKEEKKGFFKR